MKRKIFFVVVPVILLSACVFAMAYCSNKLDIDINNSKSFDVTSTNIDSSEDISQDEPVSSEDPVNSEIEDKDTNSSSSSDEISTNIENSEDISLDEPVSSDDSENSEIKDYTITFKDYDGTVLQTSSVKEGETPTYNKANPTRDNDDNYSYVFSGWSPSISEVNADAIYTATYTPTIRQYTVTFVDEYGKTINNTKYDYGTSVDDIVRPADPTKSADNTYTYTFSGWSPALANVTEDVTYKATYTATYIDYYLTLNKNIDNAGTVNVTGTGTYHFNDSLTITATTKPGYTFDGWYDGVTQVSNELSYTFNMPAANKTYEARWTANTNTAYKVEHYLQNIEDNNYPIHETDNLTGTTDTSTNAVIKTYPGFTSPTSVEQININGDGSTVVELYYTRNSYTVTLSKNIDNAGSIDGAETYKYGAKVNIAAETNDDYRFMGWYDEEGKLVYSDASKTFVMPAEDKTYTAKYINYKKDKNKVYFGTYPQKKVEDQTENEFLSNKYKFDPTTWISYKYYVEGTQSDYMYYKDVDTNNDGIKDYRGVYFTQYRPYDYSKASSTDNSSQDDNGYNTNTIYWFRYDPIEWNILKEEKENGKALILANLLLDSQEYYPSKEKEQFEHINGETGYANNYALSEIRKFLNNDFYNTAFNDLEKDLIQNTTVDNSSGVSSKYACDETEDKMFLLSYSEATNRDYGFDEKSARTAQYSEYAKCQGLYVYNNNSIWWLRSPVSASSVNCVDDVGNVFIGGVGDTNNGVRPACWIKL